MRIFMLTAIVCTALTSCSNERAGAASHQLRIANVYSRTLDRIKDAIGDERGDEAVVLIRPSMLIHIVHSRDSTFTVETYHEKGTAADSVGVTVFGRAVVGNYNALPVFGRRIASDPNTHSIEVIASYHDQRIHCVSQFYSSPYSTGMITSCWPDP